MTDQIEKLEAENALLRERLAIYEAREADRQNPNVLLLEGRLSSWEGEYNAVSVKTTSGLVYLAEALQDFRDELSARSKRSTQITLAWHVSSEQKSFLELEMVVAEAALGQLNTRFSHACSELTGYLWTNEAIKLAGHDVLEEITSAMRSMTPAYLVLRAEIFDTKN